LVDAVKIADEIVEVMQPDEETYFRVCSGYVLSSVHGHLREQGFNIEKVETTGQLQEIVQRGYVKWCVEVGVPEENLQDKRRFWTLLEWVAERPDLRRRTRKNWMGKLATEMANRNIQKASKTA
jgi:hypothetical protein